MKPVPSAGGTVELKAKTVELLVLLHGLRHENLNPLIGCLAEPPRAALVSEYCARGSLQDVLQQDDIKLDWSFRLSLLTDLVRVSVEGSIHLPGYNRCVVGIMFTHEIADNKFLMLGRIFSFMSRGLLAGESNEYYLQRLGLLILGET